MHSFVHRRFFLLVLWSLLVSLLLVCSALAQERPEVIIAGHRDLVPGENDPYYTSTLLHVWEPLVTRDEEGWPAPMLAESWEVSEDGRVWTFHLRRGVLFQDLTPFNAEAVVANFERYRRISPANSPFYPFRIHETYPGLKEVTAIDEYTVRLTFEEPVPALPFLMVNFGSAMFSPRNFREDGFFNGFPIGTGPYRLVEHKKDEYCRLEPFEHYWGQKAISPIRVRVIPQAETRFSALKAEEIFGVIDIGALTPALAMELLKDERFAVEVSPSTIAHYLFMNGSRPPFDDVRLRKAVSLAIDREFIVRELYYGYGEVMGTILSPASPFSVPLPIEHDLAEARRLAKEVLGEKRVQVRFIFPSWSLERYPYKEQAEYIQSVLRELGIDAQIQILEGGAFNEAMKAGEYEIAMRNQGLPNAEPNTIFTWYVLSDGAGNVEYHLNFKDQEADALILQARREMDMEKRFQMYARVQEIAKEGYHWIPLFNNVDLLVYNKRLKGFRSLGKKYDVTLWEAYLE